MAADQRHTANGHLRELAPGEGPKVFDRVCRRVLGMSGAEFLRKWDAGKFAEQDRPDVMEVAMLLPLVR